MLNKIRIHVATPKPIPSPTPTRKPKRIAKNKKSKFRNRKNKKVLSYLSIHCKSIFYIIKEKNNVFQKFYKILYWIYYNI